MLSARDANARRLLILDDEAKKRRGPTLGIIEDKILKALGNKNKDGTPDPLNYIYDVFEGTNASESSKKDIIKYLTEQLYYHYEYPEDGDPMEPMDYGSSDKLMWLVR